MSLARFLRLRSAIWENCPMGKHLWGEMSGIRLCLRFCDCMCYSCRRNWNWHGQLHLHQCYVILCQRSRHVAWSKRMTCVVEEQVLYGWRVEVVGVQEVTSSSVRQFVWSLADVVVFDATLKPETWRSLLLFYSCCSTCGPQCRNARMKQSSDVLFWGAVYELFYLLTLMKRTTALVIKL